LETHSLMAKLGIACMAFESGKVESLPGDPRMAARQLRSLTILTLLLLVCFAKPLYDLVRYALSNDLFSYVLLIPFISLYLAWLKKQRVRTAGLPLRGLALIPLGAGVIVLLGYWIAARSGSTMDQTEYLSSAIFVFFLFFAGACFLCLGRDTLRDISFPLGFLAFMVPLPKWLTDRLETFLQHASAAGAHAFFTLTGMPVFRQGLILQLPGMRLEVAPECSGIHSTLVLFITSLIAAQLFLATPVRRAILVFAVIPLGILRNAFRIWIIGQLCVHVSPEMINSPIHRRGGSLFFLLSLVPLFLMLYFLRRSEAVARSEQNLRG
jgi:exosortase C (VPDSG-CTERM-specific)